MRYERQNTCESSGHHLTLRTIFLNSCVKEPFVAYIGISGKYL